MSRDTVELVMVASGCQGDADRRHLPLGLLYVGSALKRAGRDVSIFHLLPRDFEEYARGLRTRNPLWVGLSVLSGMTTFHAVQLTRLIKKASPSCPVAWGGHHPSAVPEQCLEDRDVDYVVIGEGEEAAVELTECLAGGGDPSGVANVGSKSGGVIRVNPVRTPQADLDRYELDWSLLPLEAYRFRTATGRVPVGFYSSRGCPFTCSFCATPAATGRAFRVHSPEYVVRNLETLRSEHGFNAVWFSDDNFMLREERGLEILRRLARAGIATDTLDMRLDQMKEPVLEEFRDLGVRGLFFGYESANDRVLEILSKGHDEALIRQRAEWLARYQLNVWASGIIGVPTETREEVARTLELAMDLRDLFAEGSTVSTYRYMPLPGTPLLEEAVRAGFRRPASSAEWRAIDPIGPHYAMSPWLPWMTPEDETQYAWIQELGRSGMFSMRRRNFFAINAVNNFFVRRLRRKAQAGRLRRDIDVRAFELCRDAYTLLRHGRRLGLRSRAVEGD